MSATITIYEAGASLTVQETGTTLYLADSLSVSTTTTTVQNVTTVDLTEGEFLSVILAVDGAGSGIDADTLDGNEATAFEPALGNPGTNGYVLSSTTAGVRSWVEQSGGGGDVDDLTTTTGSSTNMLRVAAVGGLEYRTTAQVLSDIGAAPTASPTFTGTVTLPTTIASVIKPTSDSTAALKLTNAAGNYSMLTVDTVSSYVYIGAIRFRALDGQIDFSAAKFDAHYVQADSTNGVLYSMNANYGGSVIFCNVAHRTKNFDHGNVANPSLFIHTATNPDTDNTQWIGMWHDQTDGVIDTGTGDLRIESIVDFRATMGDSTKTVGTDAPADWVEVQIGGTTYYLPAYAA